MTRALLALLLTLAQFSVDAAPRRRAVGHPAPVTAPAAIVTASRQAAEASMMAGVPAVQIAVSQGGRVIYSEAFGMTDQESATAATPRSVLQIGSVTKQFTAAAILRLAERGALTLDDRIEKFVPEFNPRGATITLRRLLSHTSGVRREWFPPGPPWLDLTAPVTREQTITGLNNGPLLDFPPGTNWSYSNAGYMLLGLAIESITGSSYADFIHSEFALPLGLIDTGVCGTSNLPVPEGYGLPVATWMRMPAFHPSVILFSGSLCSTASDLARWSHLLATGRAMLPDSYATMITPALLANNTVVPYGLGLGVKKMLGHPAVSHDGAVNGFQSFFSMSPIRTSPLRSSRMRSPPQPAATHGSSRWPWRTLRAPRCSDHSPGPRFAFPRPFRRFRGRPRSLRSSRFIARICAPISLFGSEASGIRLSSR